MLTNFADDDNWTFFTLTGCPVEFVQVMFKLAKLAWIYERTKDMEWTIFNSIPVDMICEEVKAFVNNEALSLDDLDGLDEEPSARRSRYLCIEAWRHAILLYVCRVFDNARAMRELRKIDYHSRMILDHARCIPGSDYTQKQLLLPVFLASAEVGDERNRNFARRYCKHWNTITRFGHFGSAGELLESIWADWDTSTRTDYWWGTKIRAGTETQFGASSSMVQEVLLG
jgi:hypothetical protein